MSEAATGHQPTAPSSRWIAAGAPRLAFGATVRAVMFGVPCFGGALSAATLHGLLAAQRALLRAGIGFDCATTTNESLVTRARNSIVAHFLVSECSHLFFVDADIGFGADSVLRILAHDRPVMGGLYRLKRPEAVVWAAEWERGPDGAIPTDPRTGAARVLSIGTGFLCLRRDALERMTAAYPELRYVPHGAPPRAAWEGQCYALFEAGVDPATRRYVGEDYMFCARWRSLGGEIWCDPAILLDHHGQARFAGDPAAALRSG